ncbi:MAG: VTT domain-containing protein [Clostridia bacterium]|nr:VTT domain-containing protein [Clostridia bacterium]
MKKREKQRKYLLFGGLIMIALSVAIGVLLFSLRFEELWRWYGQTKHNLLRLENFIMNLDKSWQFFGAVMLLFAVKSFFPIYATSTVCFLSGIVLPSYIAIPVNVLGFTVLITIRYFLGRRFGAGRAWKYISKTEKLKKLIEQDGRGNPALLIALRLLPGMPVNSISGIYGSFNFGYFEFVALSIIGFMPKLISFTLVGRNIYDPLSAGFLVPVMLLVFFTGVSLLSVNGVWTTVEKTVEFTKKHKKERKSENDKDE